MNSTKIEKIHIERFGDRMIAIKGIGRSFYQDGMPISMSVSILKEKGIDVSLLHVADECLKNGWSPKTTITKLIDDFQDDIDGNLVDFDQLTLFCSATYEDQREMIFQYLYGISSGSVISDFENKKGQFIKFYQVKPDL